MSKFEELVPEHIRALGAYTPGKQLRQAERESGVRMIKMASNENPFGPSPKALEAMRAVMSEVNLYPDNDVSRLRLRLAELHGVRPEQTVVTNGSTALLGVIARTLLRPGLNAITSERSFIIYPIATTAAGGRLITVPMKNDTYDLDAIAATIDADTRIIFIANPNNPTGTLIDAPAMDAFLRQVPEHAIVILDEAYCDFATDFAAARGIDYSHSIDYVRQERNLVVLRTFSKAHGLAGMRVGYGLGPAALMQYFNRMRTTFSVTALAEAAALAALDDQEHFCKTIANNRRGAEFLMNKLSEMGYRPIPTFANFIFFDAGEDAAALGKRLQAGGIIVRPLGPWGIPTAIRVTIGKPEQNEQFIAVLSRATEKAGVR
ncbi:MAG TPA: histidinol-phosphate transaminase [Terriglobales bacterium]|nr:histidinol-phosphate transaminase [Terriglobales bacterium]